MAYIDGYKLLANAIIEQAAKDYRAAYRMLTMNPRNRAAKREMKSIEQFFSSEFFSTICSLDGSQLLKDIRKDLEEVII